MESNQDKEVFIIGDDEQVTSQETTTENQEITTEVVVVIEETHVTEDNEVNVLENASPVDSVSSEQTEKKDESTKPVDQNIDYITSLFMQINEKFDKKIAVDDHKNVLFDKMYSEMQSYKNDLYSKMLKPFILDTIMLIDDTNKMLRDIDSIDPEKLSKYLSGIPEDLADILERNGVELYNDESNTFNAKTQRVLSVIETDDISLDNVIESRVRKGYRWNGTILKPEMIQCYKYKKNN